MNVRNTLLWILIMFLVAAHCLVAQTASTGAISGTVTDASGAVLPNATVVATHNETGQVRTVTTGSNGSYQFALLSPGSYKLRFTAAGFKPVEVPSFTLNVTENAVMDQRLELGQQSEQITVEATA